MKREEKGQEAGAIELAEESLKEPVENWSEDGLAEPAGTAERPMGQTISPATANISDQQGLSLEEAFVQIEDVIANLETEEITLEQSFQEYNRGMQLLRYCNETIDRVEKKVLQINEDGGLDEF